MDVHGSHGLLSVILVWLCFFFRFGWIVFEGIGRSWDKGKNEMHVAIAMDKSSKWSFFKMLVFV